MDTLVRQDAPRPDVAVPPARRESPAGAAGGAGVPPEPSAISLEELVAKLRASARGIVAGAVGGAVLAAAAWLVLPRTYVSEATLLPSTGDEAGALPGGLASLAGTLGLSLPGAAVPESHLYPAILKSERVLRDVLSSPLDPSDPARGTLFDRVADRHVREERRLERAIEDVRESVLRVSLDEETGIVRVALRMDDPRVANRAATSLLSILEGYLAHERTVRSRRNLEFMESRRGDAKAELLQAETRLERFRDANRRIANSPELMLEEARLLRDVRVQEEVFLELTRQYEIARIEAQKAMPILEVLDPPTLRHAPESPKLPVLLGVGVLAGIILTALLATVTDHPQWSRAAARVSARLLRGDRAAGP